MRVAPPGHQRFPALVVAGEVVFGQLYALARVAVAQIFAPQCIGVVFRMAGDEDLPPMPGGNGVHARLLGRGQYAQRLHLLNFLAQNRGVARMRHHEGIVKAAQQDGARIIAPVGEHAEQLLGQRMLAHAEMVVQPGLCAPTDVEGGMHVRF